MSHSTNYLILAFSASILLNAGCTKHLSDSAAIKTDLVGEARSFIDSVSTRGYPVNYRAAQPKSVRWDLAQVVTVGRSLGISVPIIFRNTLLIKSNLVGDNPFHLDYLTQLLYYRDSTGKGTALMITAFPDSNYFRDPTRPFTGLKFVEDWLGHPVEKLLYTRDGLTNRYVPATKQADVLEVIETCYEITGYNYSPDDPDEIYYWSEPAGCSANYIDDGTGDVIGGINGSSGGGAGYSGTALFAILPGNSVIKNIQQYLQCFTNVGGTDHTYTVTVCVDQPDPGTRTAWTFSSGGSSGSTQANNIVNTGHTFLILTETYGSTTITRNVGFFPSGSVTPNSPSSPGELNADQNHYYNISGTFTVDNGQFFNILNYISSASTSTYNLNTNNCTTFAINAMTEAGINLPATTGTWPGGAGDDPGDLGQDMKNTNIPGMKLNSTAGYSPTNVGQCN
jgi:hypothetical protein